VYHRVLLNDLSVPLELVPLHQRHTWSVHEALPHFLRNVRHHLNQTFREQWIGRRGRVNWPARSPDINPLDCWLWGHLKSLMYSAPNNYLEVLQQQVEQGSQESSTECAPLCDEELRVVSKRMWTTQSICRRDQTNITSILAATVSGYMGKGKAVPVTGREGPLGCERSRLPYLLHCRLVSLKRLAALYSPGKFLVLISVRGWVHPRAMVRLEGLAQLKNPMTSSGFDPAAIRLVAKCLKPLRYRVARTIPP
jgi:hypothetical protein